ncbi:spore gernimation protein XA, partial [Bacillus thuringiensis]
ERLEIIYIAYYLIVFSTTIYPYLFFSFESVTISLQKNARNWALLAFMLLIVGLFIFLNPDVDQYLFIYSLMDILNVVFFILLPILFFAYSILFTWITRRKQL